MIYEVIVDISNGEVDRVFDYSSENDYPVGSRVKVPFGKTFTEGFIIGKKETTSVKTKDIIRSEDDFAAVKPELLELVKFLKRTQNLRLIDSLRLCVPSGLRGNSVKTLKKNFLTLALSAEDAKKALKANSLRQKEVIDRLTAGGEYESVLNKEYGASAVKSLIEKGFVKREQVALRRTPYSGLS